MKIQDNLELLIKNGKHKLVGLVDLGEGHDIMSDLTDKQGPALATQVLQFIFISDCGFRFPIAQFPSGSCTPSDLYNIIWDGVVEMMNYGFTNYWCILDGAETNRQFIKTHFRGSDPSQQLFTVLNIYTKEPMVFIMDPKYNLKKIRNNITKSNTTGKPRCLRYKEKDITWQQLKDEFEWDQSSFSLPLYEKLTNEHFNVDSAGKMRNQLAEDVLDRKMLFLMQKFKEHKQLEATPDNQDRNKCDQLDSVIMLLKYTSNLVGLFNDHLFVYSNEDKRIKEMTYFYKFLLDWREETKTTNNLFISSKLFFDLQSMCLGFMAMICIKTSRFPGAVIKPAIVNQDSVENHFCQVRACNGQNNNPTYKQQAASQSSIRFGQTTISRKSKEELPAH